MSDPVPTKAKAYCLRSSDKDLQVKKPYGVKQKQKPVETKQKISAVTLEVS